MSAPDTSLLSTTQVTCPQCGFTEAMTEECWRCGVIFTKYQKSHTPESVTEDVSEPTPSKAKRPHHVDPQMGGASTSSVIPLVVSAQKRLRAAQDLTSPSLKYDEEILLCAHLEDVLSFGLDLAEALNSAPINTQARTLALSRLHAAQSDKNPTLSQQLHHVQLLSPRALAQVEAAEVYQQPTQGLAEARRLIERTVKRQSVFKGVLRLPLYLAIYSLISEVPGALFNQRTLANPTMVIASLTLLIYAILPRLSAHTRWAQWGAQWRASWDQRELQLTFTRTLARLLYAEVPFGSALSVAASASCSSHVVEKIDPLITSDQVHVSKALETPLNLAETWELLHALGVVYNVTPPEGDHVRALSQSLSRQCVELERLVQSENQMRRRVARTVSIVLIIGYITFHLLHQISNTMTQLDQLNLGTDIQVPF